VIILTIAQSVASIRIGTIGVATVTAQGSVRIETIIVYFVAYFVALAPTRARVTIMLFASSGRITVIVSITEKKIVTRCSLTGVVGLTSTQSVASVRISAGVVGVVTTWGTVRIVAVFVLLVTDLVACQHSLTRVAARDCATPAAVTMIIAVTVLPVVTRAAVVGGRAIAVIGIAAIVGADIVVDTTSVGDQQSGLILADARTEPVAGIIYGTRVVIVADNVVIRPAANTVCGVAAVTGTLVQIVTSAPGHGHIDLVYPDALPATVAVVLDGTQIAVFARVVVVDVVARPVARVARVIGANIEIVAADRLGHVFLGRTDTSPGAVAGVLDSA